MQSAFYRREENILREYIRHILLAEKATLVEAENYVQAGGSIYREGRDRARQRI
jgi:hypothetical protein